MVRVVPYFERRRPSRSRGVVLVVDDLATNLSVLDEILTELGYQVLTAPDGEAALAVVNREHPDLVLSDVRMPVCDGFSLCRALKAEPYTRLTPVILMTGAAESDDRVRAIDAGANDIIGKPIDLAELKARVRSLMELKRFTDDLDSAEAVLRSLALTIEARDAYTEGHCERLARYATDVGLALGLPDAEVTALGRGGYFHDIGKIAIPDAILLKTDALTAAEYERMKAHTIIGERLCGDLRTLQLVRPIVRHHHERFDGSGYPDALAGEAIPLLAQIIGIVDVYDAITTTRAYHAAQSAEYALETLSREAGRGLWRPDLVEAFAATRRAARV